MRVKDSRIRLKCSQQNMTHLREDMLGKFKKCPESNLREGKWSETELEFN